MTQYSSAREHEPIPFALPDITDREIAGVADTLRSNWVTTGPKTRLFEGMFGEAVGGAYAVAVNSCTAAMHLALEALGVGMGDRVYLPTFTFAASAEVVRYLGATPVFLDIRRDTLNIDVDKLRARVERDQTQFPGRGKAVIPVHIAGVPADMDAVWTLARDYGLSVVEDAAHAFPATRDGRVTGDMPADVLGAVCFSFYATKTITTGEGGMLVTPHESIAERARSMSLHGLSRAAWKRYEAGGSWRYDITAPGFKYNMTDVAAAMGIVQLDRAKEMKDRRRAIALSYDDAFGSLSALETPTIPTGTDSPWHLYILRTADERARDSLVRYLTAAGVGSSVHFIPLHLHSYYRQTFGYDATDFPVATREYQRSLSLPIYSAMTEGQTARVIDVVTGWVKEFG